VLPSAFPHLSAAALHATPTNLSVGAAGYGGDGPGTAGVGGAGVSKHENPSAGNEYVIVVFAVSAPVIVPSTLVAAGAPSTGALLQTARFGTGTSEMVSPFITNPLVATPQHIVASSPHVSSGPEHISPTAA